MTHNLKKRRTEELEQKCREYGLPVTVQRRLVFEAIIDRHDHPTADQIYDQIKIRMPNVSRTTAYRILDTFVQLQLITKICHPGSAARFDPKIHRHHHLVCMRCESIVDLEAERMEEVTWPDVRKLGFEISDYHIHFRGICANCRPSPKTRGKAASDPRASDRRKGTKKPSLKKRRTRT